MMVRTSRQLQNKSDMALHNNTLLRNITRSPFFLYAPPGVKRQINSDSYTMYSFLPRAGTVCPTEIQPNDKGRRDNAT